MKKQILSLGLAGLLIVMLAGCGNSDPKKQDTDKSANAGSVVTDSNDNKAVSEQDTDDDNDQNTPNMISFDDVEVGKYVVSNEQNMVSLVHNDGTCVIGTSYIFEDKKLAHIEISKTYKTAEEAKKAYESLKANKDSAKQYSSMDIQDNVIYLESAESQLNSLKSLTQEKLYEKLKAEHPDSAK